MRMRGKLHIHREAGRKSTLERRRETGGKEDGVGRHLGARETERPQQEAGIGEGSLTRVGDGTKRRACLKQEIERN